ncbi:MAG: hypothetical protein ABL897_11950 [Hyphomicrobium sp.]
MFDIAHILRVAKLNIETIGIVRPEFTGNGIKMPLAIMGAFRPGLPKQKKFSGSRQRRIIAPFGQQRPRHVPVLDSGAQSGNIGQGTAVMLGGDSWRAPINAALDVFAHAVEDFRRRHGPKAVAIPKQFFDCQTHGGDPLCAV